MKKYIFWTLLLTVFTASVAWADGMPPETFWDDWEGFVDMNGYMVVGYILFAFISFWILFPLHRKEKKRLLAISLLLPVVLFMLFFGVCPIVADWLESFGSKRAIGLRTFEITSVCIVCGVLFLLDAIFIFFVFKKGWKYFLIQVLLYSILFTLPVFAKIIVEDIEEKNRPICPPHTYGDGCIPIDEKECKENGGKWVREGRGLIAVFNSHCSLDKDKCEKSGGYSYGIGSCSWE